MLWTSKGNSLDVLYTLQVSLSKLQYFRVKEGDGIQSLVPDHDEQKITRSAGALTPCYQFKEEKKERGEERKLAIYSFG